MSDKLDMKDLTIYSEKLHGIYKLINYTSLGAMIFTYFYNPKLILLFFIVHIAIQSAANHMEMLKNINILKERTDMLKTQVDEK